MNLIRSYIIPLSILLIVSGTCWAEDTSPDVFLVLPHDSKEGSLLNVGQKQYRVKNAKLGNWAKSCRIISQDNFNSRYWINLKPVPSPEKEFHGLILKGRKFTLVSSGHGATGEMLDSISFYADSQVATNVANALKVTPKIRKHPGHKLQTRFVCNDMTTNTTVTLEITNLGDSTVVFQDGGMNRGMRNNQFGFAGFRNGKALPDIGSPVHFGGRSTYVSLKKGETFQKRVNLTKWFDLSEKGYYDVRGTFYMEFHSSTEDHRIMWADYVGAQFTFTKKVAMTLLAVVPAMAGENVVHDDGVGAQISFNLPVYAKQDGKKIEYTTFRITVVKDDKFLLFADLSGAKTKDGKTFFGKIIIPSDLVNSAEILMLGSPQNSSLGIQEKLKVSSFRKVKRKKSWTDQK